MKNTITPLSELFCPMINRQCVGEKCVCHMGSTKDDTEYCIHFHTEGVTERLIEGIGNITDSLEEIKEVMKS